MIERTAKSSEVGKALGMSSATVQRYARERVIPSDLTPGGHHRFNIEEVEQALEMSAHVRELREIGNDPFVRQIDLWTEVEKNAARLGVMLAQFDIAMETYIEFCKTNGWVDENGKVRRPEGLRPPSRTYVEYQNKKRRETSGE